jgi:hypothetical protein
MDQEPPKAKDNKQRIINLTLAALAGQVGCVTLVIVIAAVFGGLWLDSHFGTKPTYTLILTIASIPVSLVIMFLIARSAVRKIKTAGTENKIEKKEDNSVGK